MEQIDHFRFNNDIIITYKRHLNCARDILLEEYRNVHPKMNRIAEELRQEQEQLILKKVISTGINTRLCSSDFTFEVIAFKLTDIDKNDLTIF